MLARKTVARVYGIPPGDKRRIFFLSGGREGEGGEGGVRDG